jgi:hypothetical protein
MKIFYIFIFLIAGLSLHSLILEVGYNGQAYSSINSAVTASASGDTVMIYPGTYYENISVIQKDITLTSRYLVTNDENDIINTIIDGNYVKSVLYFYLCQNISVIGLTIQHGSGTVIEYSLRVGGGIFVKECQNFNLNSNIIQYNQAGSCGGIALVKSRGFLSSNIIRFNEADQVGGITVNIADLPDPETAVCFDTVYKNSIYSNAGYLANDIWFTGYDTFNVSLKKGSSLIKSRHWINGIINSSYYPYDDNNPIMLNYSCEEQYFETVPQDLYVSTTGNDNNTGLTASSPLRNIYTAMNRIQSDSLNPRTIYIDEGVYTPSDGEELFPIVLKNGVSLKGINGSFTMDSRNIYTLLYAIKSKNTSIENLNAINVASRGWYSDFILLFDFCTDLKLNNVIISSEEDMNTSILSLNLNKNLRINNLSISLPTGRGLGVFADLMSNSILNNVFINGGRKALILTRDGYEYEEGLPLVLSNFGIFNGNSNAAPAWGDDYLGSAVMFTPQTYINPQKNYLINWTVANNKGIDGPFGINGEAGVTIMNSIFWNNKPNTLGFTGTQDPSDTLLINFKNCLFFENSDSTFVTENTVIINNNNPLYGNPGFLGNGDNPFALSSFSQCIDAGTTELPEGVSLPETDLAGNPRIYGDGIDLGAYEYNPQSISIPEPVKYEPSIICNVFPNPVVLSLNRNLFCNFDVQFPKSADVDFSIYNIKGQKIITLANGFRSPGESRFNWDGRDENNKKIGTGIYIYKIKTKDTEVSGKFTVID